MLQIVKHMFGEQSLQAVFDNLNTTFIYYLLTNKKVVEKKGDKKLTYAFFMRRPVLFAPKIMVDCLHSVASNRETRFKTDLNYTEGQWVGAGEPLLYITGPLSKLVDLLMVFQG